MDNIVELQTDARQIIERVQGQRLIMHYHPDMPHSMKWSWTLVVTTQQEYNGSADSPGTCRRKASALLELAP